MAALLLLLRSSLLLGRRLFLCGRFLLGCEFHRVILPLHLVTRTSTSARACVPFIKWFLFFVKKKMQHDERDRIFNEPLASLRNTKNALE